MSEPTELDEILAEDDVVEAAEPTQETVEPTGTEAKGQERDENGKFKAKASEEPEPVAEPEPEPSEDPQAEKGGTVPHQALHESRQREKAEKDRADAFERQLLQMQGQLEAVQRQVQQPQTKAEEQKPVDFWQDPDNFVASKLSPIQQQMQQQAERMSQRFAVQEFGQETVESAYAEFGRALQTNPALASEYERIKQSDHPYGEIVQWHKQQQTRQLVGDDPNAWLEAQIAERMADPAFQAKVMEAARTSAGQQTTQTEPVTSLPKSLNRLPGGGNAAADADMSDEALFNHATG